MWIFGVELTLAWLIIKTVVLDEEHFVIYTPNIEVYICRFVTALLLHMELIEDVKQGINMMHFLNTHPDNFTGAFYPFVISLLQTFGGLIAEALNLFMLSTRSSVADCITFYVAFRVLSSVDNIYAESLSDFVLKEAIEEPLIYEREDKKTPFMQRSCLHKVIRITWRVVNLF